MANLFGAAPLRSIEREPRTKQFSFGTRHIPAVASEIPDLHSTPGLVTSGIRLLSAFIQPGEEKKIKEEYFVTEVRAYGRLKPLQRVVTPSTSGIFLSSPEDATMMLEDLSTLLRSCYRAPHAFSVHQDDSNLSNFRLVDGTLSIKHLADDCVAMQAYYRDECSPEAA
ncbi:uncharacterized protein B0H64DRAFT_427623 [Chaetomium fimeti]|uniref:Uncharacterized protein n=1 Tax=Chaetomium fimeti TaxID=1854472 RepID=A0AAE0H6A9_9PEZI|nr:hypothetical protein B0H64DRAFT_427623 [Chaetomium fimeti]